MDSFTGISDTALVYGAGFQWTWPDEKAGSDLHLLIDDIRITDGTNNPITSVPNQCGGVNPDIWPKYMVTGFLDNRDKPNLDEFNTGCDYRYQYVMPETFGWSPQYVQNYVDNSDALGFKSAIVWYNLGKVGESQVAENLASSSFMKEYFTRFDTVLNQMANSGKNQKDYIIVLEPDMYGKLMQDGKLKNNDAKTIPVAMEEANRISGKNYESNLKGCAEYMIEHSREKLSAKGLIIGHMLNHWGINIPRQIGQGRLEAHIMGANAQGDFLNSLGNNGKGDVVFVEKTDRDAGNPEKSQQD